jgi:replication initiator protein RepSA
VTLQQKTSASCARGCGSATSRSPNTRARGVVHFHAVIRLDAPGEDYQPPPPRFTTALLCQAIDQAAAAVAVTIDTQANPAWPALTLRFGAQVDTKPISRGDGLPGTAANYPSKRSATTSPSTPPKASTSPACPTGRCAPTVTSTPSHVTSTTSA